MDYFMKWEKSKKRGVLSLHCLEANACERVCKSENIGFLSEKIVLYDALRNTLTDINTIIKTNNYKYRGTKWLVAISIVI